MTHWRRPRVDNEMRMTLLAVFGMPAVVGIVALVAIALSLRNS